MSRQSQPESDDKSNSPRPVGLVVVVQSTRENRCCRAHIMEMDTGILRRSEIEAVVRDKVSLLRFRLGQER